MKKPRVPTKKSAGSSRENASPLPRIEKIFALLENRQKDPDQTKPFPTLTEIAEGIRGNDPVRLSDDTIARCLDMMRDDFNMPVAFDRKRKGHGFTQPVAGFPLDVISEEQVYYLIQSVQMLKVHKQSKAFEEIRKAVKKACRGITLLLGVEFEDLEDALSFHVVGFDAPAPVDPELFKAAMRAILQRAEVTLEHRSVKRRGEVKQKTVEPLHLSMINHALYFWHYDPTLEGKVDKKGRPVDPIRKFALTRIGNIQQTGKRAELRPFDVQERVDRGMGAWDDEDALDVEIHFTPEIAPLILERTWHKHQLLTQNSDGSITMKLRVAHTPELEAFIVRWAGEVEVVSPPSLRERMGALGRALQGAHS